MSKPKKSRKSKRQSSRAHLHELESQLQITTLGIMHPEIEYSLHHCVYDPGRILSTLEFHNSDCGERDLVLDEHFSQTESVPLPVIRGGVIQTTSDTHLMITTILGFATVCHTQDQEISVLGYLLLSYIRHLAASSSPQCPSHRGV